MCGICGELSYANQARPNLVAAMAANLAHRGPDASSLKQVDAICTLAHRRLSIIDLSDAGNQPMSDGNLHLVFNGCIYNYRQLRAELSRLGAQFRSSSDTEVILKAWQQWGESCLQKFDGMFAFALYDDKLKTLFVARDRFGIKPLYYSDNQDRFNFASTLPALLKDEALSRALNRDALHFMFHIHAVVPAPETVINSVKKLEPGHLLTINAQGKKSNQPYWQLSSAIDREKSTADWQQETHELLKNAVYKRLSASDVPVGVLLSGGLDSSLIVALAEDLRKEGKWNNETITFSIGFDDVGEEKGSEFFYSDQVVEQFHSKHNKFHISNDQLIERLPEAINHMSEPMFGQDCIAFYLLSEQVAKESKVVLSGQGADEVFGGYSWYPKILESNKQHPQKSPYEVIAPVYFDRNHAQWSALFSKQWHGSDTTRLWLESKLGKTANSQLTEKLLALDASTFIVDDPVKRVDNMTMAWSLEARVPFLDSALVEHALKMPASMRLERNGKAPLKNIAEKWFKQDFIDRKKGYFPTPALKIVRGPFLELMKDALNSQAAKQRGLFQQSMLNKFIESPELHLTNIESSKLWQCALLELWLQNHVDG